MPFKDYINTKESETSSGYLNYVNKVPELNKQPREQEIEPIAEKRVEPLEDQAGFFDRFKSKLNEKNEIANKALEQKTSGQPEKKEPRSFMEYAGETISSGGAPRRQGVPIVKESKGKDILDNLKIGWQTFKKDSKNYFADTLPKMTKDLLMADVNRQYAVPGIPEEKKKAIIEATEKEANIGVANAEEYYKKEEERFKTFEKDNPDLFRSQHIGYSWNTSAYDVIQKDKSVLRDPGFYLNATAKSAAYLGTALVSGVASTLTTGSPIPGVVLSTAPALSQSLKEEVVAAGGTPEQGVVLGATVGPVLSLIEVIGELPLINLFVKGFTKSLAKNFTKELAEKTVVGYLKGGAKQFSKVEASEILEENLQSVMTNAAIKTIDENRSLLEGLDATTIDTAIATAPFALLGVGAEGLGSRVGETAREAQEEKERTGRYPIPIPFGATIKDVTKGTNRGADVVDETAEILRGTKGQTADDIMKTYPNIQLKRDVPAKDVYGNKVVIPDGEKLTPYEMKDGKILLQDGQTYLVTKNQFANIKGQSVGGEAKPFAPELEGTEESVLGFEIDEGEIKTLLADEMGEGMSRQDAIDFIEAGEENMDRAPKYNRDPLVLPGGENYKEILIKAPEITPTNPYAKHVQEMTKKYGKDWNEKVNSEERQKGIKLFSVKGQEEIHVTNFNSSHWDEPNVLSHLRMNWRKYKGKAVAFMEELQSDWAKEGREKGFVKDQKEIKLNDLEIIEEDFGEGNAVGYAIKLPDGQILGRTTYKPAIEKNRVGIFKDIQDGKILVGGSTPNNALLKNWQEWSIKRALQEAVNSGAKYFAWVTGEQTSARYDLATYLDKVEWGKSGDKGFTNTTLETKTGNKIDIKTDEKGLISYSTESSWKGKKLDEALGKGLADKIMEKETGSLSGEGLKFGGEWAINLYDKQVGNIVKKLTGAKVIEMDMGLPIEKAKKWFAKLDTSNGQYRATNEISQNDLEEGNIIYNTNAEPYVVTKVLKEGKFEVVEKQFYDSMKARWLDMEGDKKWKDRLTPETFSIGDKTTTQQGIELTPEVVARIKGEAPVIKTSGKMYEEGKAKFADYTDQGRKITYDKAIKFLEKMFPNNDISLFMEKELFDDEGRAIIGKSIGKIIELIDNDGKIKDKVLFHESFHTFFRYFVKDSDKEIMLNYVKKEFSSELDQYKEYKTYDLKAEELLADRFANYVKTKEERSVLKKFFDDFIKFFTNIKADKEEFDFLFDFALKGQTKQVSAPKFGDKGRSKTTPKQQRATGKELIALKEEKKAKLDSFMETPAGRSLEMEVTENIKILAESQNTDVLSGIRNNPYYRKEKTIKDDMGSGWLLKKDKRHIVAETKDVEDYVEKGYVKKQEIDSIASEAGFENGEDYLNEQLYIAELPTSLRSESDKALSDMDREYTALNERLDELKSTLNGKKVTMEKYVSQLGKESRTSDRKRKVTAIRSFFGLTDRELKQINRRDVSLMTNTEFNRFLEDIEARAFTYGNILQKRNEIATLIRDKELVKAENLRKAMDLPLIDQMDDGQLDLYFETLAQYDKGDEFLPSRMLETIDRTKLEGRKTHREVREYMSEKTGLPIEKFENIMAKEGDRFRYDSLLAQQNPLYDIVLRDMYAEFISSDLYVEKTINEVNDLAKKARKSTSRGFLERVSPTDTRVINWLESNERRKVELAKEMTDEELTYAQYLKKRWQEMYEYLVENEYLGEGIENYYAHMRRGLLEAVKDDGFIAAAKEMFKQNEVDALKFEIMDDKTGEVLPMEKFFANSQKRSGKLIPTQDSVRSFITYVESFERMRAINSVTPLISAYSLVSTPQDMTDRGLLLRGDVNKLIKEWMNNKRGRKSSLGGILKQGGKLDRTIRFARAAVTVKDLGLSLPVGIASMLGERVATVRQVGPVKYLLGEKRALTKQGRAIYKKYEGFVGESFYKNLSRAGVTMGNRLMSGMFGLFHVSNRTANINFLLGNMTKEEFESGEISNERLADMKLEMGEFRANSDMKSIFGSTSAGSATTQYRSWAIPLAVGITKDFGYITKELARLNVKNVYHSKELRRTLNSALVTLLGVMAVSMLPDDDDTLIGKTIQKAKREILTLLQSVTPTTFTNTIRLSSWLEDVGKAITTWIKMERYADSNKEKSGELKGPYYLWRQIKPTFISQFLSSGQSSKTAPVTRKPTTRSRGRKTETRNRQPTPRSR